MSHRQWHIVTSVTIIILSVLSSLLGLLNPGHYSSGVELLTRTRAEDLVILVIAVPVLAISVRSWVRGSSRGQIVWLGSLSFMTYMWATRAVSLKFNQFFLGYVALFSLSLFTLVGGISNVDADTIQHQLDGLRSERVYAGILAFIALGLASLWLTDVIPATMTGTQPGLVQEFGSMGLGTIVIDLGIVVPTLLIASYWLLTGKKWGYVISGVLLVFGALLAPALTAITLIDVQRGVAMTPGLVAGTFIPPLVALIFAVKYVLALTE